MRAPAQAAFYVATAPLIYALARHYQVMVARAWWVDVLAIRAPMNVYTVYFMPESCYFFFMRLFFFGLLTATSSDGGWRFSTIARSTSACVSTTPTRASPVCANCCVQASVSVARACRIAPGQDFPFTSETSSFSASIVSS